jgi:hypothetical protein
VRAVAAIGLCAVMALSSCSFFFVEGPPPKYARPKGYYFSCTESRALPTLDAVLAAGYAVMAVAVASMEDEEFDSEDEDGRAVRQRMIITGVAWAAIFGGSSLIGFRRSSDCREARWEMFRELQQPQPAVPAFHGPPGSGR